MQNEKSVFSPRIDELIPKPEDLGPQLLKDAAKFAAACYSTLEAEQKVALNVLVEQGGHVEVAVVVIGAQPRITLVGVVGERRIELGHVELKVSGGMQ